MIKILSWEGGLACLTGIEFFALLVRLSELNIPGIVIGLALALDCMSP